MVITSWADSWNYHVLELWLLGLCVLWVAQWHLTSSSTTEPLSTKEPRRICKCSICTAVSNKSAACKKRDTADRRVWQTTETCISNTSAFNRLWLCGTRLVQWHIIWFMRLFPSVPAATNKILGAWQKNFTNQKNVQVLKSTINPKNDYLAKKKKKKIDPIR